MKPSLSLAWLATLAVLLFPQVASAQHAEYDELVATHADVTVIRHIGSTIPSWANAVDHAIVW